MTKTCVIVGGGAAGFFASIQAARSFPQHKVILLEGTHRPLTKVRISGGGRCNVTHHCFDTAELVTHYPRGYRELRGPFSRFQPQDTVAWFAKHGVKLKTEADGRMFPTTDKSQTIIKCLTSAAQESGVEILTGSIVKDIKKKEQFTLQTRSGPMQADSVLLATGSMPFGYKIAQSLGHTIEPLVPSLFTFVVDDLRLKSLAGISFPQAEVKLRIEGNKKSLRGSGPILITHWGLSGPVILRLSAFAARQLFASDYHAKLCVNWLPQESQESLYQKFRSYKDSNPRRHIAGTMPVELPKRFWQKLLDYTKIPEDLTWGQISQQQLKELISYLVQAEFKVSGKGEFKSEFVTAGGVRLKEIDMKTMQSRTTPGLFFAGEILDIDGVTGGFNFQNAWTTGWIAGSHMG